MDAGGEKRGKRHGVPMKFNPENVRKCLKSFDFKTLFREHLGWDNHQAQLDVPVDGITVSLTAIAQKRGFVAFVCRSIPDRPTRLKIDHQVTKSVREHFAIYADEQSGQQVWHWVRRETGKPLASRDHRFDISQSGDPLIQRLERIAVSMEEEEGITLPDIAGRNREAFDVDKVTKKFYERFKAEHAAFLKLIKGFPPPVKVDGKLEPHPDLQWYTSLMLNRLMFVYFIQKKGFLDGDTDYLRSRLALVQQAKGKDKFQSFYRYFLLRLFHDGLGKSPNERKLDPAMEKLLGKVPYLNGGFFEVHPLEKSHDIDIPDQAFEKLFDFFEYADKANGIRWNWHLDERELRADNEINPDVVGYIFEKYINQKQMGAYYTKEDITEYISKNTIIPYLFDAARKKCAIAFKPDSALWRLLRDDSDRYIYPAVGHGVTCNYDRINHRDHTRLAKPIPLPAEIEQGVKDVSKREGWNKSAPETYALPTETWREVVARRQRCLDIREKLCQGEVHEINDLITLNLNIWQFARDAIVNAEGPELLRAFWHAIAGRIPEKSNEKIEPGIAILDPTCGSGAFLFAALRILETLYSDCLERMERFLEDIAAKPHHPKQFSDFKDILAQIGKHPNERYFVLKSIIINNLFGVDIMEEAVEICKLRLFLKLVAQVETVDQIEPLPDIDFNIRSGNTLVGYASLEQVRKSQEGTLGFGKDQIARIEEDAEMVDRAFQQFRAQQTKHGGKVTAKEKHELLERLAKLDHELDRYLAGEYGVTVEKQKDFEAWKVSHQPFHWFVEFYGIMHAGGFDVIMGNPPYLEIREVDYALKNYACLDSGAIHAMCMERSAHLLHKNGCMSMIVPLSLPSTQRMEVVQNLLEANRNAWYANYAWRPAKLFDTVNRALTIFVVIPSGDGHTFSTNYQKWTSDDRDGLFERLTYVEVLRKRPACWIPKLGDAIEQHVLKKCLTVKTAVKHFIGKSEHRVYYRTTGGLYWKVFTDFAPAFNLNGKKGHSSRETWFTVGKKEHVGPVIAALSSGVFWWWYSVTSNVRDLNPFDIQNFPLPESALADPALQALGAHYLKDLDKNSAMLVREQKQTGKTETQSFKIQKSKPIIDEIDRVLAKHYGFTDEELDFIVNYDIKYRMGGANGGEDDE